MPPDMAVSMRHTKLKAEEAALIAGELTKPSWESRNEGIHERVSFEDTIWGFDLAGGIYYRTPLRVTLVKPDSRAEKAGIKPGDRLLRINDIDTATLTIQQAHDIILDSGIHLKLAVTAPDDLEDAYYYYEDPIVEDYDSEEERRKEEEKARRREVHARVSSYWSLQWPWVSKRRIIYRESNCYLVPSKFEEKHKGKFEPQPVIRYEDDIVLHSAKDTSKNRVRGEKITEATNKSTPALTNGVADEESEENGVPDDEEKVSQENSSNDVKNNEINVDNDENADADDESEEAEETKPRDSVEEIEEVNGEETEETEERVKEESQETEEKAEDSDSVEVLEETSKNFDDLAQDMMKESDSSKSEDDNNIIDSILSDNGQNIENSEAMNER